MIQKAKYIFIVLGFSLMIISCSEKSTIMDGASGNKHNSVGSDIQKCDSANCNYHMNMKDANPDYIPPDCGKCNGKWNNYRHRGLMNERECYFGKGIKR